MHDTEYAYAVARIRANEASLMDAASLEQLIEAASFSAAVRLLADKGWAVPDKGQSFDICEKELSRVWQLICECAPDASLLQALVIGNDFSNLKAAVKATFSNLDASQYLTYPCVSDPMQLADAIKARDFDALAPYLRDCANKAYDCIVTLESGQLAEVAIDTASLNTRLQFASRSGSGLLVKVTRLACAVANIKVALRCAAMGKGKDFAREAMCECDAVDVDEMLALAYAGKPLAPMLMHGELAALAGCADKDFSELEMKCDNTVIELIESAKYETFGPDPLVAFYLAKQAEVRNVRIILSAKSSRLPAETIRQRVRKIYV